MANELVLLKVNFKSFSRTAGINKKILSDIGKDFTYKDVLMIRLIIPVVTTTAAAAIVATFFVTSATAAAAEASLFETATAAAAALLFGLRFVNDDLATHYFGVVEVGNGLLSFAIIFHFHKTKAFAATGNFVFHDLGAGNGAVLFKKVSEILVGHLPGEVAYINVHCTKN